MIYIVVPEACIDAMELANYVDSDRTVLSLQVFDGMREAADAARAMATRDGRSYTVRKLVMVSYHRGRS